MRGQNPGDRVTGSGVAESAPVVTRAVPFPTATPPRGGSVQRNASVGRRRHPGWVMTCARPRRHGRPGRTPDRGRWPVGQVIGALLPLAVGVALSPVPIIAVILMLLARKAGGTSGGFVLGWVVGIVMATTLFLVLAETRDLGSSSAPSTAE